MAGYAVVDVETTGLWPGQHRIVEIGVVLVDEAGAVEGEWVTLVNPGRDLGAQHIHGIVAADILDAPTFAEIADDAAALLSGRAFVAHNASFDRRFVQQSFSDSGLTIPELAPLSVCTMHWAGQLMPVPQRSLAACCAYVGVQLDDAHEALADARAAAGLLAAMLRSCGLDVPWRTELAAARAASWPERRTRSVRTVHRGISAQDRGHFLSRLVDSAPGEASDAASRSYLGMLDLALIDRFLSVREQRGLVDLADELGIGRPAAAALHRAYLRGLARAAWADGIMTAEERADLDAVATLLGMGPGAVDLELDAARGEEGTTDQKGFALAPGDLIVFTGDMARPRAEWEERARRAGLVPHGAVTKKVALVVAADPDSLSGKARKAESYGIPIIGESAFDAMLVSRR